MKRNNSLHHTSLTEKKALLEHMRGLLAHHDEEAKAAANKGDMSRYLDHMGSIRKLKPQTEILKRQIRHAEAPVTSDRAYAARADQ